MASSISVTHSEATAPSTLPGLQPRDATLRPHSSPSAEGRGYGICSSLKVTAPACPSSSSHEKVRDGDSPERGSEYSMRSPSCSLAVPKKRSHRPCGPP